MSTRTENEIQRVRAGLLSLALFSLEFLPKNSMRFSPLFFYFESTHLNSLPFLPTTIIVVLEGKKIKEMEDLEGWEVVPDDGFLQIHDDGGKQIFSRKYGSRSFSSHNVFKNYFICPPPSISSKFVEITSSVQEEDHSPLSRVLVSPKHIVSVPIIQFEPTTDHRQLSFKETTEADLPAIEKTINPSCIKLGDIKISCMLPESDQDPVTRVSFKKMKETEFVDMKILESPTKSSRGMKPPPLSADGFHLVEEEGEVFDIKKITSSPPKSLMKVEVQAEEEEEEESVPVGGGGGGFNLWKWSLTGIGAICSSGVAAATVCIIIFGAHHRNTNQQQHEQSHKLLLCHHIYADEKVQRMKEEAIADPLSRGRAHISVGGYYNEAI